MREQKAVAVFATPWSHDVSLPAVPPSAGAARAFVATHLQCHNVTDRIATIELVTSELATNAIEHARTPFTVTVRGEDHEVRVAVHDGCPDMGTSSSADPLSLKGRGLLIAQALSDSWGVEQEVGGKSVWALFTVAAPAPA